MMTPPHFVLFVRHNSTVFKNHDDGVVVTPAVRQRAIDFAELINEQLLIRGFSKKLADDFSNKLIAKLSFETYVWSNRCLCFLWEVRMASAAKSVMDIFDRYYPEFENN